MNKSQNSGELFSGDPSDAFEDVSKEKDMETASPHESLLSHVKSFLNKDVKRESTKVAFHSELTETLDDCASCVTQSLHLITTALHSSPDLSKIKGYLENVTCLIKLLSDYIKSIMEHVVPCAYAGVHKLPVATGQIILMVFTHCRESEVSYAAWLSEVQQQVRELFRVCHQLQLTYLLLLNGYYLFHVSDVSHCDTNERQVLLQVISLNLEICETVETLDVKTLAEQWKGCLALCQQYSQTLQVQDSPVYLMACQALCHMLVHNLDIATQRQQDPKVSVRSEKLSGFALKILLKLHLVFQPAEPRDFDIVVRALTRIYNVPGVHNDVCHPPPPRPSPPPLASVTVTSGCDALLDELVTNHAFVYSVTDYDPPTALLGGYILLVCSLVTRGADEPCLLRALLAAVPRSDSVFPTATRWRVGPSPRPPHTMSVHNYLVYQSALVCVRCDVAHVSDCLYDAVLETCWPRAVFATQLWLLLSRLNPSTLVESVTTLCETYSRLRVHPLFPTSPQRVHLSHAIAALCRDMSEEQRSQLYRTYSIRDGDETNAELWACLRVRQLPRDRQRDAEVMLGERYTLLVDKVLDSEAASSYDDVVSLTTTMSALSTSALSVCGTQVSSQLTALWVKLCPHTSSYGDVTRETHWLFEFVMALTRLTRAADVAGLINENSAGYLQIVHVMCALLTEATTSTETKLLLVPPLCDLISHYRPGRSTHVDTNLKHAFTTLLQRKDIVTDKLLIVLQTNKEARILIFKISNEVISDKTELEIKDIDIDFTHKCIPRNEMISLSEMSQPQPVERNSNNFEFADIDSLLGGDNDSEPVCKKMKMDDVQEIIQNLQTHADLLWRNKENITHNCKETLVSVIEQLTDMKNYLDK